MQHTKVISIGSLVLLICIFVIPVLLRRFENESVNTDAAVSYSAYDTFYSDSLKAFQSKPTKITKDENLDLEVESVLCEKNIIDICYNLTSKQEEVFTANYLTEGILTLEDGTKYSLNISNFSGDKKDYNYYIGVCQGNEEKMPDFSKNAGKKAKLILYTFNREKKVEVSFQIPDQVYKNKEIAINKKYSLENKKSIVINRIIQHAIYSSIEYSCNELKENEWYILDVFDENGNQYTCLGGDSEEKETFILNYEPFTGKSMFAKVYFHDASSKDIKKPDYLNSSEEIKFQLK